MLHVNDQVEVRDALWQVQQINVAADGKQILQLASREKLVTSSITVVSPPEKVVLKKPAEFSLNRQSIGPLVPWLQAHRWLQLTSFSADNQVYGARFGRVLPEAYQLAPTVRILNQPRPRLLIADDVGLGKTVEAGLCMLELIARGRGDRILIIVPPGLIDQWHDEELIDKFNLEFEIIENATGLSKAQTNIPAGLSPWEFFPRIITSMEYLKKPDVLAQATKKRWSLIIVDEAHALAESGTSRNPYRTQRSKMAQQLRDTCDGLLLLTATPHNGYSHSFRSLLELVEPTAATLGGTQDRTHARIRRARIRRLKSQITRLDENGNEVRVFPKRNVEPIGDGGISE